MPRIAAAAAEHFDVPEMAIWTRQSTISASSNPRNQRRTNLAAAQSPAPMPEMFAIKRQMPDVFGEQEKGTGMPDEARDAGMRKNQIEASRATGYLLP